MPAQRAVETRRHADEEVGGVGDRVLLPRQPSHQELANLESGVARLDDAAEGEAHHGYPERHLRKDVIGAALVHPVAESGIERRVEVLDDDLARRRRPHGVRDDGEIVRTWRSVRATGEDDGSVGVGHVLGPFVWIKKSMMSLRRLGATAAGRRRLSRRVPRRSLRS